MTTIHDYPLEKRKILKKTVTGVILWLLIGAVVVFGLYSLGEQYDPYLQYVGIFFGLIAIAQPVYQYLYFNMYHYDVRKDFLVIKKGVIAPRETILAYDKIQDVYVDQDILDRIMFLYDVHVSTATATSGFSAHIDGVNKENADAIREQILKRIKRK